MSKIALSPNANGAGIFTIASPNSGTDRTLTLPDETGTLVSTGGGQTVTAPAFIPTGASVPANGMYLPTTNTVAWSTNSTERMRVDSSGNVGIGSTSPSAFGKLTLQVDGTTSPTNGTNVGPSSINLYAATNGTLTNSTVGIFGWQAGNPGIGSGIGFSRENNGDWGSQIRFYTHPTTTSNLGDITERARINASGELLTGGTTDNGAYNLQCNGTAVWGAGAYVNGSDARIKEDVAPISSSLEVVEKLNPVTYRYKESWSKDQSTQTGFIAQELLVAFEGQNYVGGVVQQGGAEGYYSVAYQNIIPILTKAIQELNAKVEAQAAEIAALKGAK